MKFSLSVNVALAGYPMEDRIRMAADIGWDGVDVYMDHFDLDPVKLKKAADEGGIPIVSVGVNKCFENTLDRSWPQLEAAFTEAFEFAEICGAKAVPAIGGFKARAGYDPEPLFIENCKRLAELGAKYNKVVMVEPVNNTLEHQTASLYTSKVGADIVKAVNSPNLRLLFDFIHLESAEGNVLMNCQEYWDLVQMYHVVGIPAHDEPFHSPLDYPYLLAKIEKTGYQGFIGAEYAASYDSLQSAKDVLKYLKSYENRLDMYMGV